MGLAHPNFTILASHYRNAKICLFLPSGNEPFLKACCTIDQWSASFLQFDEMLPIATVFAYLGMFRMSDHLSDAHGVLLELLKMEGAFPDLLFVQIALTADSVSYC